MKRWLLKILPFGLVLLSTAAGTVPDDTSVSREIIDRCNAYADEFRCQHEYLVPGDPQITTKTSLATQAGLAVYYAIPSDLEYDPAIHERLIEATLIIQAWYQITTGGFTWQIAFPEIVRVYYGEHPWTYYRDNGNWWGGLMTEMSNNGELIWAVGTVTTVWARGAGWWAGAAQGCGGDCGLALLGVSLFPEFNDPTFTPGECPGGAGVAAWPCTPEGAYAHELGHTLGLPHPIDDPITAPYAYHSIMNTHWNFPDHAPRGERPWGFLRTEREQIHWNPFMHPDVDLIQLFPDADVVNLPPNGESPVANFFVLRTDDLTIEVQNQTAGATHYYWTFGDGGASNSTNPTHTYDDFGTYEVTLRASNDAATIGIYSTSVKIDGPTGASCEQTAGDAVLIRSYPNPFNPATTIEYELRSPGEVSLTVYDAAGRLVTVLVKEHQSAGRHQVEWRAEGYASGIYYCRLLSGGASLTQKLVLLK